MGVGECSQLRVLNGARDAPQCEEVHHDETALALGEGELRRIEDGRADEVGNDPAQQRAPLGSARRTARGDSTKRPAAMIADAKGRPAGRVT